MPRHPRARWWFWSAGSVEALLCRSDGPARERRSWIRPIFVFSRKSLDLQLSQVYHYAFIFPTPVSGAN
ncbi:hypothetical protein FQN60_013031 [Etheostoma spectabile]|uniref:Secreted protein n=1 Tax=Etheostoma spectabile TaxID=54343 RepID=A0A5J5DAL9_9PERO|nr:hypothetical protein FQN60_013031 [Etheostoma spectabile]